jgi:hypothetical protein
MQLQFVVWGACVVKGCRRKPVAEVFIDQRNARRCCSAGGLRGFGSAPTTNMIPEVNVRLGCPEWQREYQTGGLAQ